MVKSTEIRVNTKGKIDIINIQHELQDAIDNANISQGIVTLFVPGSTGGLTTVEYEPGLIQDIKEFFEQLAPYDKAYAHHNTWHDDNGSSHLQASLLGPSLSIPIVNGQATLGTWQQPIFIDFDTRPRQRKIIVQIVGE